MLTFSTPGACQPGLAGFGPDGAAAAPPFTTSTPAGASLDLQFAGTGALDPRITFTRASSASYFDATGTLQSAGSNVARFDYNPTTLAPRGLLIEEARTNSIRNSTMAGAVPGTPGTLPTNWAIATMPPGTMATQVIGTGTEGGISYVDVRLYGTATGAGQLNIQIDNPTASPGQIWTASMYCRLVGGSTTNVSMVFLQLNDSTPPAGVIGFTPIAAALVSQRSPPATTRALAAGTTRLYAYFGIQSAGAGAVDLTVRIGAPQLELGVFATSFIPTTGAAATRAADVATMPTGSWFNPAAMCLALEATMLQATGAGNEFWVSLDDGTANNRLSLLTAVNASTVSSLVSSGGVNSVLGGNVYTVSPPATFKYAIQVASGNYASCAGGVVASQAATQPVGVNRLALGTGGGGPVTGYLRRVRYWPRALGATELQAVTR